VWRLRALRALRLWGSLRDRLRQVRLRLRRCLLRRLRLQRMLHLLGTMPLGVLTATTSRPTSTVMAHRAGPCLVRLFLLDWTMTPRASAGRRRA
jgi:hypothetical protein